MMLNIERGIVLIKAVVFDMGGVIQTSKISAEKQMQVAVDIIQLLGTRGLIISDTASTFLEKLKQADKERRRICEETLQEVSPLRAWVDLYLKDYGADDSQIFPIANELSVRWSRDRGVDTPREGLLQCLSDLQSQGMRLAVISNTFSRTLVPSQLAGYGTLEYFEYILLSSVCGIRKPAVKIFDICQESMNLSKGELAYVGDTISRDVIGVKNAEWELMIRIAHPEAKAASLEREKKLEDKGYHPDYFVHQLTEIPDIIQQYNLNLSE